MSTTEKTDRPYGGATRAIIGWLDDENAATRSVRVSLDDSDAVIDVLLDILGCYAPSQDSAAHGTAAAVVGDGGMVISGIDLPPHFADGPTELAASRTRDQISEYNTALASLWISDLAASHGVMMFGSTVSSEAQAFGVKPMRAFVFPGVAMQTLGRHCDFHSSSEGALADITRIIGSVFSDWREALSTYLDDDSEPTAYSDDAGDYPPLPRDYVDVKVRIHGDEKAKPRRYTDEDHQVWRH